VNPKPSDKSLGYFQTSLRDEVIENAEIEFSNILDTTTDAQMAMMKYETLSGTTAVPMTNVIDREGNVIDAWYGYEKTSSRNSS